MSKGDRGWLNQTNSCTEDGRGRRAHTVQLTDEVLFGDVLKRNHKLTTMAALIAGSNVEHRPAHLSPARENSLSEAEVAEGITHLAFYAGWPRAMSAIRAGREVFER
jgi:4-carboxymuconolactone decarboxylase